jgi:spermidine synthase
MTDASSVHESVISIDLRQAEVISIAYSGTTDIQRVLIADTVRFGRVLTLDGIIQSAAADERLYHEALVQPAMLRHYRPRDVLIIGGGEGATLREVLKHDCVHSVTMVDIDRQLVDIARTHLTDWHQGAFDDPRVRMFFDDGRRFIERDGSHYDVVIIDVVDLIENGPAQSLYTREFYNQLRDRLRPGAIVVVQALEFSFLHHREHVTLARTLKTAFSQVHSYSTLIPSFQCEWGFTLASDWCDESSLGRADFDNAILARLDHHGLRHLDGAFIEASFAMCKRTRSLFCETGPVFEDGRIIEPTSEKHLKFPLERASRSS